MPANPVHGKKINYLFFILAWSNGHHQDKAQPETQARAFGDVGFNAVLAVDDPSAMSLVRQPGSDGFRLDSTAMFQVFYTLLCVCILSYINLNCDADIVVI